MRPLEAIASSIELALVEDAAQAHLATAEGRPVGTIGIAAAFSFYPTKNLGALGDGGAVLTSDAQTRGAREAAPQRRTDVPLPSRGTGREQPARRDAGGDSARHGSRFCRAGPTSAA